jgi:uncharacterized protein
MPPEFSVPVSQLDAAGRSYTFRIRSDWIRGALEAPGGRADSQTNPVATSAGRDGELDVRLSKSGADVVVHGRMTAEVRVPCARCLEPVTLCIDEPVTALMVRAPHPPREHEHEVTAEEADTLSYDGETVVLDDLLRDELLLEIPMIPLCSEDCPGISPPPGETAPKRGTDPRLAPLSRIKPAK